ncbi:MAG: HAMP domain-containing histidine kinase, partial [Chitinispirillaceae bacterium]|nr:HAMP domain-containing histidine kinase [Chitinispirillaceae bacterium]
IIFDNIDVPDKIELMNKIKLGYPVNNIEGQVRCKNGRIRYVIMGATSIFWHSRRVIFSYLQDVTTLKELQFELEKKNREIINLTNTITHDLRNPLTGIKGIFELSLLDNKKLDENDKNLFQMALKEVEYMQSLLEDLLDAAKIDESNKELKKEEIYAKELIDEILNLLKFQMQEKNIEVLVNVDDIKMLVDPHQFKKVLMNLIGNAINYSDSKKRPQIVIEAKQVGEEVELSIKDNGIGIPEEALQFIFEKFKRGPNIGNIKGSGLGLFIVKNIVEKHGGKIFVESKVGEGSKFVIKIPNK